MIEYENLGKSNQSFFKAYEEAFHKTLFSGRYILGDNVKIFEEQFANYTGSKYCVGVASGLDALSLALRCLEFPTGSEVILPSNTYIATILSVIQNGLKPVLVEPDIETYNIDPAKIEEKITSNTRAIIPVHLYGKCCDMDAIIAIAEKYQLYIIEDCAQSHGAKYKGQVAGSFGDFGAHSFYPTKNLGALGDAGAITTHNVSMADKIKALRNYGSRVKYENDYIGYNSRLDEMQAGFLSAKLALLNQISEHKRILATLYFENLGTDFIKPFISDNTYDVYHIFTIRHKKRNELRQYLLDHQVQTEIHYPIAPHKQKAMQGIFDGEYPISEEIHATTLSLPISFFHTKEDIYQVIEVLNNFT